LPDLGPWGRGGARRRTRRRITAMNEASQETESSEDLEAPSSSDQLVKLARLQKIKE
jgi:hypothetical protein